jgi:hypothetical protein
MRSPIFLCGDVAGDLAFGVKARRAGAEEPAAGALDLDAVGVPGDVLRDPHAVRLSS